jgi:hypothetical protein
VVVFVFIFHSLDFGSSAEGLGLARAGITSFSYFRLSVANPAEFQSLYERVAKGIEDRRSRGELTPGLSEQLDMQLATLRNDKLPDVQTLVVPNHYPAPCALFNYILSP